MLCSLTQILNIAEAKKCAIGSFNTPNMTSLRAILAAAEETQMPVIIMHAQVHEEMGLCKMDEVAPIMLCLADRASVPVCVHLDHGTDLSYVKKGLDLGFTSVMYDGSLLPFEQNVANTKMVVEIAEGYGASVEAEIGAMGAGEGTTGVCEGRYTDPDEAQKFVELTGVDALACSFGTVHGLYAAEPNLDFERISEIRSKTGIPVVMHGGSGVSEPDFKECISRGVRKINYYTYAAKAAGAAVKEFCDKSEGVVFFHDMLVCGREAMKQDVKSAMEIFCNK